MAKNVQGVVFLRNGSLYESRQVALNRVATAATSIADGQAILARYTDADDENKVKTIVGFKYSGASSSYLTLIDVEGLKGDAKALVDALRIEINDKLGTGVTSANTATAQLAALSGGTFTPDTSSSADTSVEGAKAYAYDLIGTLDYTDAAVTGSYVSEVTQSDGKIISTTKVELPSVTGQAESKKVVISVSEDKGTVSDAKGTISSSAETIVLSDNADGGINFDVNIDNASIVQDETTNKLKVADSALTQNYGDEKTIHAEVDSVNNTKTFSTLLKIVKNANPSETEVKEEYFLADADGTAITGADTIKIYKDSHIVSITYITDSGDTHYQNLEYKYIDASGATKTEYVDISSLVLEVEFASGLTIENHVARGVVDPQSEKDSQNTPVDFLTVGADGFKVSGIKDEIDRKLANVVADLDATVTGETANQHITISIEELDGKLVQSGLTITESNIANADDLVELSGKTITDVKSANGSVTVTPANAADGTKEIDLATDASKIKMSGFTVSGTSSFSGIAESDSVSQAFDKANAVITENERVTAAALNDLNDKIEAVSGASLSGVSVNDVALTKTNNAVNVQISGSTAAPSGTVNDPAIIVNTNQQTGAITLGIGYIDCGTYDD